MKTMPVLKFGYANSSFLPSTLLLNTSAIVIFGEKDTDMEDSKIQVCKECGKRLCGRSDKQFCSRECKNRYNNRKNSLESRTRSEAIKALDRNHGILASLLAAGTRSAGIEELVVVGFDPDAVSAQRKGRCGHSECHCFDIVYSKTDVKIFDIHRKE